MKKAFSTKQEHNGHGGVKQKFKLQCPTDIQRGRYNGMSEG